MWESIYTPTLICILYIYINILLSVGNSVDKCGSSVDRYLYITVCYLQPIDYTAFRLRNDYAKKRAF